MNLRDAFTPEELPLVLVDLSRTIEMVDGWVLHEKAVDPDAAMLAANLFAYISKRVADARLSK